MFYDFIIEPVDLSVYLEVLAVFSLQLTSVKSILTVAFEHALCCAKYSALSDRSYFSDVYILLNHFIVG